ncbi:FCD domain-containing protein [Paenirhodobacter sp.]|uniref:FCD domain-containing protein n=1 Tax=Paenirhodobacter sp. TaxID=1965326 RepID=UPI003B3C43A2
MTARPRVAERLEQQIEALIRSDSLQPGDRLPSERDLAQRLGASRSSLREAIGRLVHRNLVEVRQTGIVVAEPVPQSWAAEAISAPLSALVAAQPAYGRDVLEVRRALEGAAAQLAAERADPVARQQILACLEAMEAHDGTSDPSEQAHLDAAFHLAIAKASNNAVLHQVMASLFDLLSTSIQQTLEKIFLVPRIADTLARQHRAIYDAIAAGDADAARAVSDTHLEFVAVSLREADEDLARKARAARMLGNT